MPLLRAIHRWLGLVLAAVWGLQAITGLMLVFHWELDDATVRGPAGPLVPAVFGRTLDAITLSHPGDAVSAVYASAGRPGRFDVMLARPDGHQDVLRVDGRGEVLRARPADHDFAHIGVFQIATYLHQTLFAHQWGTWLIGMSGVILLSNLAVALRLAWPRPGLWRRALLPGPTRGARAGIFAWHRGVGLWLVAPAAVMIGAGVVMAFANPLSRWPDAARPAPAANLAAVGAPTRFADAVSLALNRYPRAAFWAAETPSPGSPWFKVEIRQPGEWRRAQGTTALYVADRGGRLLADYDALKNPLPTRVWDSLYAIHTGEAAGVVGRVFALLVGAWLLTIVVLGLWLWAVRRPSRTQERS